VGEWRGCREEKTKKKGGLAPHECEEQTVKEAFVGEEEKEKRGRRGGWWLPS
jgi:hypothetical protein